MEYGQALQNFKHVNHNAVHFEYGSVLLCYEVGSSLSTSKQLAQWGYLHCRKQSSQSGGKKQFVPCSNLVDFGLKSNFLHGSNVSQRLGQSLVLDKFEVQDRI
jgi:hypothetical protein